MIKIIKKDGKIVDLRTWQVYYDLDNLSMIGKFFSINEKPFKSHVLIKEDYLISETLIKIIDETRNEFGKPIHLSRVFSTPSQQDAIKKQYGSVAAKISPHEEGMGADIDVNTRSEVMAIVKILRMIARQDMIKIRIGHDTYLKKGMTIVHVDVCPEYFAKGKPYHERKHPLPWENQIEW